MIEQKNVDIISLKIVVLGDSNVGKDEFINKFCYSEYNDDSNNPNTYGVDTKYKYLKRGDKKIELGIWDTAGQERFKFLPKHFFGGADGILFIYDITNMRSFALVKNWINDIKKIIDKSKIGIIVIQYLK